MKFIQNMGHTWCGGSSEVKVIGPILIVRTVVVHGTNKKKVDRQARLENRSEKKKTNAGNSLAIHFHQTGDLNWNIQMSHHKVKLYSRLAQEPIPPLSYFIFKVQEPPTDKYNHPPRSSVWPLLSAAGASSFSIALCCFSRHGKKARRSAWKKLQTSETQDPSQPCHLPFGRSQEPTSSSLQPCTKRRRPTPRNGSPRTSSSKGIYDSSSFFMKDPDEKT